MICIPNPMRKAQTGSTLMVTMLMLILIMLLGITAMNSSTTIGQLATNLQFEDMAQNKAEAAIDAGELWMATGTNYQAAGFDVYDNATPQIYPPKVLRDAKDPLNMTWDDTTSAKVGGDETQRYVVELISKNQRLQGSSAAMGGRTSTGCNTVNLYLITGRGQASRGAVKFIQSFYSVLNC